MNTVSLTGRLTRDPELRQTPSGTDVCTLRIAYGQRDPAHETGFIDVTAWAGTARAVATYLTQGDEVGVTGELRFSQWETDGVKKSRHQVNAASIDFLRRVGDHSPADGDEAEVVADSVPGDEEVPF